MGSQRVGHDRATFTITSHKIKTLPSILHCCVKIILDAPGKHLEDHQLTEVLWRRQWQPTPVLLPGKSHGRRSLVGFSYGVAKSQTWLSDFSFTFYFHALEKEMATHSSVLAWRIPGTAEPGGLLSMGSHRVGHNWSDLAAWLICF